MERVLEVFKNCTNREKDKKVLDLLIKGQVEDASALLGKNLKLVKPKGKSVTESGKIVVDGIVFDIPLFGDDKVVDVGIDVLNAFLKPKIDSRDWSKLDHNEKYNAIVDFVTRYKGNRKRNLRVLEENVLTKDGRKVKFVNGEISNIEGMRILPNGDFTFENKIVVPEKYEWKPLTENTQLFSYFRTVASKD